MQLQLSQLLRLQLRRAARILTFVGMNACMTAPRHRKDTPSVRGLFPRASKNSFASTHTGHVRAGERRWAVGSSGQPRPAPVRLPAAVNLTMPRSGIARGVDLVHSSTADLKQLFDERQIETGKLSVAAYCPSTTLEIEGGTAGHVMKVASTESCGSY